MSGRNKLTFLEKVVPKKEEDIETVESNKNIEENSIEPEKIQDVSVDIQDVTVEEENDIAAELTRQFNSTGYDEDTTVRQPKQAVIENKDVNISIKESFNENDNIEKTVRRPTRTIPQTTKNQTNEMPTIYKKITVFLAKKLIEKARNTVVIDDFDVEELSAIWDFIDNSIK